MRRLIRCFPELAAWLIGAAFVAGCIVYGSIGHGWANHQTMPGAGVACAIGLLAGAVVFIWGVMVAIDLDTTSKRRKAQFRAQGRPRVVADYRDASVRIVRSGGGVSMRVLGEFKHDDVERAMDCMEAARAEIKPELDARREAKNLARLLNR